MKAIISLITLVVITSNAFSSDIQISYNISNYQGGNNISCNGSSDGWINIFVIGGTPPYYFNWSNGMYSQNLTNLTAGNYTVTVTDAQGNTGSATIPLRQPNLLHVQLNLSEFDGGYNISSSGGNDGIIETEVTGGTRDYSYSWSNGSSDNKIDKLIAGNYSITITDMNGCSTSSSTTLTEPSPLHVVSITSPLHNGYNVSCNGGYDGAININVTGGVPPYNYNWSNGSELQNPIELRAGHFSVIIHDAADAVIAAQIDLTEPQRLRISNIVPLIYPNGYNLSCFSCSNGSLTVISTGGITPLAYQWESGQTINPLTGIGAGVYYVVVSDANGCSTSSSKNINPPPIDAWSLSGNSNTSNTQYFGTSDNKDLVLKTNNSERLKILSSGNVITPYDIYANKLNAIDKLTFSGLYSIIYKPATSSSKAVMGFGNNVASITSCISPNLNTPLNYQFNGTIQVWQNSNGGSTDILEMGHDGANAIIESSGTSTDPTFDRLLLNFYCGHDVFVGNSSGGNLTANQNFYALGNVGIGTSTPSHKLDVLGNTSIAGELNTSGTTYLASNQGNIGIGTSYLKEKVCIGNELVIHDGGNKCLARNFYWDNATKKLIDGYSSAIFFTSDGGIRLNTAGFGTANSTFNWNNGLHINNTGQVGINVDANPLYALDVNGIINAQGLSLNGTSLSFLNQWQSNGSSIYYNQGNIGIGTQNPNESYPSDQVHLDLIFI